MDELLSESIGQRFNHNVQSVRVLDEIFEYNLTLETLDGILCHNGEMPSDSYRPRGIRDFADFDERVKSCKADSGYIRKLIPATKEGCLVRICDMIAYLGKDRQDYVRAGLGEESDFAPSKLMENNSQIIHNLSVNIIENSIFGDCIRMDESHYAELKKVKEENYRVIYMTDKVRRYYDDTVRPMMKQLFDRFVADLKNKNESSVIYKHHIDFIDKKLSYKGGAAKYLSTPQEIIAADYIASMTDSYFLDVHSELFGIRIHSYFHGL